MGFKGENLIEQTLDIQNSNDPAKWKKHLVLVNWKLRELEDLNNSIRRYAIDDYRMCIRDIDNDIKHQEDKYIYIIKLVYQQKFLKLPNIVISCKADLCYALSKIESYEISQFSEIWFCKNLCDNSTIFGRMLIDNGCLFPHCNLHYDMVWGSSARIIEKYPWMDNPFVSYERSDWNESPHVTKLVARNMNSNSLIDESTRILMKLAGYRKEIINFAEYVFSVGCNSLCLEYSFSKGELRFIDWDSDNDNNVLKLTV